MLAYMVHGKVGGRANVMHLWPSHQDDRHAYCVGCSRKRWPQLEKESGVTFEQMWRSRRDIDHVGEAIPVNYYTPGISPVPLPPSQSYIG